MSLTHDAAEKNDEEIISFYGVKDNDLIDVKVFQLYSTALDLRS